jgi:hypothetical protein
MESEGTAVSISMESTKSVCQFLLGSSNAFFHSQYSSPDYLWTEFHRQSVGKRHTMRNKSNEWPHALLLFVVMHPTDVPTESVGGNTEFCLAYIVYHHHRHREYYRTPTQKQVHCRTNWLLKLLATCLWYMVSMCQEVRSSDVKIRSPFLTCLAPHPIFTSPSLSVHSLISHSLFHHWFITRYLDEYGRPFIILKEQQAKARVKGLEATKVLYTCMHCFTRTAVIACHTQTVSFNWLQNTFSHSTSLV